MPQLPFGQLSPYVARRFVPEGINLGDWEAVRPLFDKLEARLREVASSQELEAWLIELGELQAALEEEGARRYIAMTCDTDDTEAEQAYLDFVENVEPKIKPRHFRLAEGYLRHPVREQLSSDRYHVFDRDTRVEVELYREANVPLETEENKLGQRYQKLSGGLTVEFRGEEKTLTQMAPYLEEPDRGLRQEVWELVADRRWREKSSFDDIFDQLFNLRKTIASNAGFSDYRDYAFRAHRRFDYTPEDCEAFHRAVEVEVMPAVRSLQQDRLHKLELSRLRPWDLAVDPMGRPPLKPFSIVDELVEGAREVFLKVDPELGNRFRKLQELGLLDLANRKGKAPGGYQTALSEARLPFIFMNAVGMQRDVETLLHESGHAFHTLGTRDEDFLPYREAPIEFCEVASMTMELIGNEYLDVFMSPLDAQRARRDHLKGVLKVLPWIATIDAFQHWLYTHPDHGQEEREEAWVEIVQRFGGIVDWTGYEGYRRQLWHRQLHLFLEPFYYIEYGIAQIGALQIWNNWKKDPKAALTDYKKALELGGSRPLPELFETAGCRFRFDAETLAPLVKLIQNELARLDDVD